MKRCTRWAALAATVSMAAVPAAMSAPRVAAAGSSTWSNPAVSGPAAQVYPAMAYDQATGTDVLFTVSGQTWTWNGNAWTQQSPAVSPPGRYGASMAYDSAHQTVVLFGGQVSGTSYLNDTWTWNGSTWTQQNPTLSPPARAGAAVAWDSHASRVMLFGGYLEPGVFYADTWAWSGTTWNELVANYVTAAAGPAPRAAAAMVDDQATGTIVLFGGASYSGGLADTWEWSPGSSSGVGTWTAVSPQTSPAARAYAAIAYSPGASAPVLFGGSTGAVGTTAQQDTWTWDGGGWAQATPTGQPPARDGAAMATGPDGGVVMFGGQNSSGALADTWTWSGAVTSTAPGVPTIISCPVFGPSGSTYALPTTSGSGTLRGAAAVSHPTLYVGSALPSWQQMDAHAVEQQLAGSQFNLIASSNQMWWGADEPRPGVFNYCDGDQFVGLAQAYHQTLRLHNLVAGAATGQLPNWLTAPSVPWTAATLTAVLQQYITTTVTHYKGKVSVYDVVNEAVDDNGNPVANVFQQAIGYPKYIELAFQYAHAADPSATLIYDDYNDWYAPKQAAVHSLVQDLVANSHIDGVGFELFGTGAWMLPGSGAPQSADLQTAMSGMASLGVKTAITQMTVPFFELNPGATTLASEASVYKYAMTACLAPASNCFMFTTWGLDDGGGPAFGLVVHAFSYPTDVANAANPYWGGTLFDETYQPRPAFNTVLALLQ